MTSPARSRALGSGADALVDALAYDEIHARQLIDIQGVVGSLIVVSSSSVYRDRRGRTLDEAQRQALRAPRPDQRGSAYCRARPTTYRRARRRSSARCWMKPPRR